MSLFYSIATEGVNSGFKSMALAGFSFSGSSSITYTPSGGVILNGVAVYHPVRSFSFSGFGNILTDGSGYYQPVKVFSYSATGLLQSGGESINLKIKDLSPQGGALIRGTGIRSKEKIAFGVGGILSSGQGQKSLTRVPTIGLNDVLVSGSSNDSVVKTPRIIQTTLAFSGTSVLEKVKSFSMSGGALLAGSGYRFKQKEYYGLGLVQSNGIAATAKGKSYQTILNSVLINGDTLLRKLKFPRTSGGMNFGGQIETIKIKEVAPTTGLSISGSSYNVRLKHYDASGGVIVLGGESYFKNTIWSYSVITSVITSGGVGGISKTKVIHSTGLVSTSGTGTVTKLKDYVSSSGFSLAGAFSGFKVKDVISTGHVASGGVGVISKIKTPPPDTLQISMNGTGTLQYIKTYVGINEIEVGGSGEILKIKLPYMSGGVYTSGYAVYKDWPLRSTIYHNQAVSKQELIPRIVTEREDEFTSTEARPVEENVSNNLVSSSKISKTPDNNRTTFIPSVGRTTVPRQGASVKATSKSTNTVTITKGSNKIKL